MFRLVDRAGIGNMLIFLSQLDDKTPVSDIIYSGFRGKYLKFKNLNIIQDDGSLESIPNPPIYINPHTFDNVHPMCSSKVEPSDLMKDIMKSYTHLLDGVTCCLSIRMTNALMINDPLSRKEKFTDENVLQQFDNIIINSKSDEKFFIVADTLDYKRKMAKKFPGKCTFIDMDPVFVRNTNTVDSPAPYIEFFLMAMCPKIIMSGGITDMSMFTTYPYMASRYGMVPLEIIWTDGKLFYSSIIEPGTKVAFNVTKYSTKSILEADEFIFGTLRNMNEKVVIDPDYRVYFKWKGALYEYEDQICRTICEVDPEDVIPIRDTDELKRMTGVNEIIPKGIFEDAIEIKMMQEEMDKLFNELHVTRTKFYDRHKISSYEFLHPNNYVYWTSTFVYYSTSVCGLYILVRGLASLMS
jgi:hypothetical protein